MLKRNAVYGLALMVALAALAGCSEDNPLALDRTGTVSPSASLLTPATVYVDSANTSGVEDGSAAYPYNTIAEGLAAVSSGGVLEILTGTYDERGLVVSKNLTIRGPADKSARVVPLDAYTGFIFEVRNSTVTFRNLWVGRIDDARVGAGIGSGNPSTSADILIDNCSLVDLRVGAMVNDWGYHQGDMRIEDTIILRCYRGVQENDAGTIRITRTRIEECASALAGIGQVDVFSVTKSKLICNGVTVEDTNPAYAPYFSPSISTTEIKMCPSSRTGARKLWYKNL